MTETDARNEFNTGEVDLIIDTYTPGSDAYVVLMREALLNEYHEIVARIKETGTKHPTNQSILRNMELKIAGIEHEIEMEAATHPQRLHLTRNYNEVVSKLAASPMGKEYSRAKTAIQNKDIETDVVMQRVYYPIKTDAGESKPIYATPAILTRGYIQAAMINKANMSHK